MRITPPGTYYAPLSLPELVVLRALALAFIAGRAPALNVAAFVLSRSGTVEQVATRKRARMGSYGELGQALVYVVGLDVEPRVPLKLRLILPKLTGAGLDAIEDLLADSPAASFVGDMLTAERMSRSGLLAQPWNMQLVHGDVRIAARLVRPTIEA